MKQLCKRIFKVCILAWLSLGRTFDASAGCPVLPGCVALKKQGIYIISGILPAVLVKHESVLGKAHGGKTIVLGDNDIPGANAIGQKKVHAVCALVTDYGLRPILMDFARSVICSSIASAASRLPAAM